MPTESTDREEILRREYELGQRASALARRVYGPDEPTTEELVKKLLETETELGDIERMRLAVEPPPGRAPGRIVDTTAAPEGAREVLDAGSSDLEITADLRMTSIPTSVYHVFDRNTRPLVEFKIRNAGSRPRRLRLTSFVEGYSARAIDTVRLGVDDGTDESLGKITVPQLPTLFHDRVADVGELTAASLNVIVEDLDNNGTAELHRTTPVRLLARNYVPMTVRDPTTGERRDLSRYLGALVTPSQVMDFLRTVANHHPLGRLAGYDGAEPGDSVESQVRAVFAALRERGTTYVNSVVAFNPEDPDGGQRVRLPRESLRSAEGNCIDATLLIASILEAMSLSAAIVLVPHHAFVGWESATDSGQWTYLETTMIGGQSTFEDAVQSAAEKVELWLPRAEQDAWNFRQWPVGYLRAKYGITPLE
jgi:hypothetical protein